ARVRTAISSRLCRGERRGGRGRARVIGKVTGRARRRRAERGESIGTPRGAVDGEAPGARKLGALADTITLGKAPERLVADSCTDRHAPVTMRQTKQVLVKSASGTDRSRPSSSSGSGQVWPRTVACGRRESQEA